MESEVPDTPLTCPNTVTVRRNPHRRARPTPSCKKPSRPLQQQEPPSSVAANISSFPIDEIMSMETPQPLPPQVPGAAENLKVYLRIRPLTVVERGLARKTKVDRIAWPTASSKRKEVKEKNEKRRNGNGREGRNGGGDGVCLNVGDDRSSVTLTPPDNLKESKRIKEEIYQGFSRVFSPDSSQNEVFESMVKPLVHEFLGGKSGLLASLGPSGSGKTHTVFGSPRDPGMVPLIIKQIFEQQVARESGSPRMFYFSMFEIRSEGGKVEKLFDLSSNGLEIAMQQSTVKGLQEVVISDIKHAESFIVSGLLKRATAVTNINCQSSRSQCVINIRKMNPEQDGVVDMEKNSATLTIIDLAGAEREKRTGNQGTRLLESNSINNTSMVFSLCLRSLLEHQKNPKKPLEKHFQNSLLTRYLRDYLEGKKRMTLILTVKPGEDDYLDTSYLLRQASPFTKIKFDKVEVSSANGLCAKRVLPAFSHAEHPKRIKFSRSDASNIEDRKNISEDLVSKNEDTSLKSRITISPSSRGTDRQNCIMHGFAKSLWKILKEYNEKLKAAEREIQSLNDCLINEKSKNVKLAKELMSLKSSTVFDKNNASRAPTSDLGGSFESAVEVSPGEHRKSTGYHSEAITPGFDNPACSKFSLHNFIEPINQCDGLLLNEEAEGESGCLENSHLSTLDARDDSFKPSQPLQFKRDSCSSVELDVLLSEEDEGSTDQSASIIEHVRSVKTSNAIIKYEPEKTYPCNSSTEEKSVDQSTPVKESLASREMSDAINKIDDEPQRVFHCKSLTMEQPRQFMEEKSRENSPCKSSIKENRGRPIPDILEHDSLSKSKIKEKPKRRLLPASSMLLKDSTLLCVEDDAEKPKGNRGGKKFPQEQRKMTRGNNNLLRLLQSNLHLYKLQALEDALNCLESSCRA